jgi:hypothetical protein
MASILIMEAAEVGSGAISMIQSEWTFQVILNFPNMSSFSIQSNSVHSFHKAHYFVSVPALSTFSKTDMFSWYLKYLRKLSQLWSCPDFVHLGIGSKHFIDLQLSAKLF